MSKPHINDTELFKRLASRFGGYTALTAVCWYIKSGELNNGK